MLHVQGQHLVNAAGDVVRLRGFTLTALYWEPTQVVTELYPTDEPYRVMREVGANVVRLTFHARLIEREPFLEETAGLEWLDQQLDFAQANGLYVILCLILPPGADWMDDRPEPDYSLWSDLSKQERFRWIWRTLLTRYKGTTRGKAIAAFDLFNAPATIDGNGETYRQLLQSTVNELYALDSNRIFVIAPCYGTNGMKHEDLLRDWFLLDNPNVIYDLHFYDPFSYTHQYAEWVGVHEEGGVYPDCSLLEPTLEGYMPRCQSYLAKQLEPLLQLRMMHEVPIFISEFGLIHHCFEDGRGGLAYVNDVITLLNEAGIGFTYWDFQSTVMGLFRSDARLSLMQSDQQRDLALTLFKT